MSSYITFTTRSIQQAYTEQERRSEILAASHITSSDDNQNYITQTDWKQQSARYYYMACNYHKAYIKSKSWELPHGENEPSKLFNLCTKEIIENVICNSQIQEILLECSRRYIHKLDTVQFTFINNNVKRYI